MIIMTWKDILKDDMRRIRDKDRRRNPREKDEVDIEPKPEKELPPPSKKPFDPFAPDAGKRAKEMKRQRKERAKREKVDSMMDTERSKMGKLIADQKERYQKLKDRRAGKL